jgi:DNA-binding response OmpR family regulator
MTDLSQIDPILLLKALTASLQAKPNFCFNCGYNDSMDSVIERDGFVIDILGGGVTYQGKPIKLQSVKRGMLYTLAKSYRRRVSAEMLAERCCHDGVNASAVRTHLSRLRHDLESQGAPVPFKNESGIGYYWSLSE